MIQNKLHTVFDWFNPWSKEHNGNIKRFSMDLNAAQRILTGIVSALATIILLGFGGVAVFRLFTEKVFKKIDLDKGTDPIKQLANRVNQSTRPNADSSDFDGEDLKTYELTEVEVRSMNKDSLWDKICEEKAERLVIQLDNGDAIIYEKRVLERLSLIRPSIEDFVEKCTLKFASEEECALTRAKLHLCGDFFKNYFEDFPGSTEVPFPAGSVASFTGFLSISEAIDTDEYMCLDKDAANYLLFPPASFFPEGIYGQKEWDKWGDVGIVPPPPAELLTFMDTACPISNDERLAKDTHVIMWIPATIDGITPTVDSIEAITKSEEKFGDRKKGYDPINSTMRSNQEINKPIVKGYWAAMYKKVIKGSMHYVDQQAYIANSCPGYEVPTVRDAIFCSLMNYICTGVRILASENFVDCTQCKEETYYGHAVVGSFAPSGLLMHYCDDSVQNVDIGICPVRKFFGK